MGMSYSHLLIPANPEIVPSAHSIESFLRALDDAGYLCEPHDIRVMEVQRVAATSRSFKNPFTGETTLFAAPTRRIGRRQNVASIDMIAATVGDLCDYDVQLVGEGPPSRPPVPLECDGAYHLAISCHVRSAPVSMSDLHEESRWDRTRVRFDEPCADERVGLFSDPTTLEIIEVPDAGCARFWIAFELGKSLFPPITHGNLDILDRSLVTRTREHFGIEFVQGCSWG